MTNYLWLFTDEAATREYKALARKRIIEQPLNYNAGGVFFVRYVSLPVSLVWEAFKIKMVQGIIIAFGVLMWRILKREGQTK